MFNIVRRKLSTVKSKMIDDVFKRFSVAIVTPFHDSPEQQIDFQGVREIVSHVSRQLADLRRDSNDIGGIIVSGTTGEQHTMSIEERIELYKVVVDCAKEFDVPVACGIAATTNYNAAQLAIAATNAGCSGVMLGLPPYCRCTDEELTSYVVAVKSQLPVTAPILLYNNVIRNGYSPSLEIISEWHQQGLIYGMKYAVAPHTEFIQNSSKVLGIDPTLPMYTGSDILIADFLTPGVLSEGQREGNDRIYYGLTSIVGNIIPGYMGQTMLKLLDPATRAEGLLMHQKTTKLATACLSNLSVPVGVKFALNSQNHQAGVCRKPVGIISSQKQEEILNVLKEWH